MEAFTIKYEKILGAYITFDETYMYDSHNFKYSAILEENYGNYLLQEFSYKFEYFCAVKTVLVLIKL